MPEAARHYDLTQQEIERWMDDTEAWMENVLKASPTDIAEQYEPSCANSEKPMVKQCWSF